MPSIAKGIRIASPVSARSVIIATLVGALVIGLFFINEIVHHFFGPRIEKKESVAEFAPELSTARSLDRMLDEGETPSRSKSAFDQLFGLLNRPKTKVAEVGKPIDTGVGLPGILKGGTLKGSREKLATKVGVGGTTWQTLRSPDSMNALRNSINGTSRLVKAIPTSKQQTRAALFNYIGGLRLVVSGGERTMTATEAVNYLAELDEQVLSAMRQEAVSNSEINTWGQISVSTALEHGNALRQKSAQLAPFTPNLKILGVSIKQPPNGQLKWIEGGKAYLTLMASVRGSDVTKIMVFRDGYFVRSRVPQKPNARGDRVFFLRSINARGNYTFVVLGSANQKYEKSYSFYDKARRYPWRRNVYGFFTLPFYMNDPRIDRYFTIKGGLVTREQTTSFFNKSIGSDIGHF